MIAGLTPHRRLFGYQGALIHLSSTQGPIEVYLCPEENDALSPMKTYSQDHNGNISKTISKGKEVSFLPITRNQGLCGGEGRNSSDPFVF